MITSDSRVVNAACHFGLLADVCRDDRNVSCEMLSWSSLYRELLGSSFETCCPDSYPGHGDCAGRGRSATEASDVLVISDVFD